MRHNGLCNSKVMTNSRRTIAVSHQGFIKDHDVAKLKNAGPSAIDPAMILKYFTRIHNASRIKCFFYTTHQVKMRL
jgi:hypothetical protein